MSQVCSVCKEEENYNRNKDVYYICGSCIQQILLTEQEFLHQNFDEAIEDGDLECAWAVRMFLRNRPEPVQLPKKR